MSVELLELVPPESLIMRYAGGLTAAQFVQGGDAVVEKSLLKRAKLPPGASVLDIGCGCGRIARPLTRHLSAAGRYAGIDVGRDAIDWCRAAYAPFANFRFHHADLRSSCYNPEGAGEAASYMLPFGAAEFDYVYLGSVFTHMLPDQVEQYLREIARVMKPAGTCLATFFLLDGESRANNAAGRADPRFAHEYSAGCLIRDSSMPEDAVAYEEELARGLYAASGLAITEVYRGEWGRRGLVPHMQDLLWARRAG